MMNKQELIEMLERELGAISRDLDSALYELREIEKRLDRLNSRADAIYNALNFINEEVER